MIPASRAWRWRVKGRYVALTTATLAALLAVVPSIAVTGTQQTDETTRQIIAEEFLKKRPAPAKTSAAAKKPAYRLVNPSASPKATRGDDGSRRDTVAAAALAVVGRRRPAARAGLRGAVGGAARCRRSTQHRRSRASHHRITRRGVSLCHRSGDQCGRHEERGVPDIPDVAHAKRRQRRASRAAHRHP